MNQNSNYKNIFWTALISIILTLTAVIYFTDLGRDSDEGNFEHFFKSLSMLCFIFFVPATIIYSIIFGKIDKKVFGDNYYFFFFGLAIVIWALLMEAFDLISLFEDRVIGMIVLGIISLIITKMTTNSIFKTKNDEEEKEN